MNKNAERKFYTGKYPIGGETYLYSEVKESDGEFYPEADWSINLIQYGYFTGENELFVPLYKTSKEDYEMFCEMFVEKEIERFGIGPFNSEVVRVKLKENWREMCIAIED